MPRNKASIRSKIGRKRILDQLAKGWIHPSKRRALKGDVPLNVDTSSGSAAGDPGPTAVPFRQDDAFPELKQQLKLADLFIRLVRLDESTSSAGGQHLDVNADPELARYSDVPGSDDADFDEDDPSGFPTDASVTAAVPPTFRRDNVFAVLEQQQKIKELFIKLVRIDLDANALGKNTGYESGTDSGINSSESAHSNDNALPDADPHSGFPIGASVPVAEQHIPRNDDVSNNHETPSEWTMVTRTSSPRKRRGHPQRKSSKQSSKRLLSQVGWNHIPGITNIPDDEVDCFLRSIAPILRALSSERRSAAMIDIVSVVHQQFSSRLEC
ncbi:uncharacterized protein LOC117531520 [Thalassophryne amazonica]|uniref:uncharacterized protein LOC117531520 n=1 Tax=Thalassophryne amazonica TaxID=390379 RepID=UPI001470A738|nr:uncharacterized protein LOC117531520 [Thalassophryne amazonica]XP_034050525.1 uncharacterized protein LOC117531520 [Thalassophryne amazonica]